MRVYQYDMVMTRHKAQSVGGDRDAALEMQIVRLRGQGSFWKSFKLNIK